ncbi:MAG: M48 family metalloprotease [Aquabacterium sp.]
MSLAPVRPRLRRIRAAVLLAVSLGMVLPMPVAAQVRLPSLGEAASDDFNVATERRLGEQVMRDIRRDPDYADDPLLVDYLQALWQPLVKAARVRGDITPDVNDAFAWEAFLVRDRAVNAFALPGGFVGIHYGLIAVSATQDELASVLAHELSHVTQRHIARMIGVSSRASMIGLATVLLGILAASRSGNADVANAAIQGGQAVAAQAQLNFSRDMEREADRNGFALMSAAGYSGLGMVRMFERLDQAYRLNDSGNYPYLRSHPLTTERQGEARLLVSSRGSVALPKPRAEHVLMQARARVLMDPSAQALRHLQDGEAHAGAADDDTALGALYAAALASLMLGEAERADRTLGALQARLDGSRRSGETAAQRVLAMLGAQVALASRDLPRALRLSTRYERDGTRAGLLLGAQVELAVSQQAGQPTPQLRAQIEALQTWLVEHKADAAAWTLLAQCAQAQGLMLRAVRALAESHAALGDINGAIDRLRAGQELARRSADHDFVESSVIDARLRQLLVQRRDLMAELRGETRRGDRQPDQP